MELKDRRRGAETGIYIACNDRALLDTINTMMGRRGIVGISDAEGKFHYIVDGRKNSKKAISKIDDIVSHSATVIEDEVPDIMITSVLKTILVFYDFELTLTGTCAIFEIVRRMVIYRDLYFSAVRQLYAVAGDILGLSYGQIERDIRYSIKKSSFDKTGIRTAMILRLLADDVMEKLKEIKRQPV